MKKFLLFIICPLIYFAQDDLLNLVDTKEEKQYVFSTWKSYRLGNAQTTETVKKKSFGIQNPAPIRQSGRQHQNTESNGTYCLRPGCPNRYKNVSGVWCYL